MILIGGNAGRIARAIFLGLAAVVGVLVADGAQAQAPAVTAAFRAADTDLIPDPSVSYLVLANGLRVALRPNRTPAHAVSFRLSIRAGSLNEADDERGFFHFIEHMAFNGSGGVEEGGMTRRLAQLGIAFGAGANGATNQAATTYSLDIPTDRQSDVDECLFLLREIASEVSFDPAAVEREKKVVLAELRVGDTFERRSNEQEREFLLPGAYAASRMPAGEADDVARATAERLRLLYGRYYRPERATLVVAGDFDDDKMAASIAKYFGDWSGRGAPGADPDLGYAPPSRKTVAAVSVDESADETLSVYAISRYSPLPDTVAGKREQLLLAVGVAALNQRLSFQAGGNSPPFRQASLFETDLFKSANVAGASISIAPGRWKEGITALEQTWRSALEDGFTLEEIDQQRSMLKTLFALAVQEAPTRQTPTLASELAKAAEDGETFLSPEYRQQLFAASSGEITPASVQAVFRKWMARDQVLFFATTNGNQASLAKDIVDFWTASQAAVTAKPQAKTPPKFAYASFGKPGVVANDQHLVDLDARAIVFANGVRLTLKRTSLDAGSVLVSLRAGEGAVALQDAPDGLALLMGAYAAGGLEKNSVEDLRALFGDRIVQLSFTAFPDHFGGVYATRAEDLKLQLQLAAAYMLHPAYRPDAEQKWRLAMERSWRSLDANARAVFASEATRVLASGDKRFGISPADGVTDRTFKELKSYLDPILSRAPIEIAIVGDVSEAAAIDAVAATFGALPQRRAARPIAVRPVNFARFTGPAVLHHHGEASQALLKFYWPVDIDPDQEPQAERALNLLASILGTRLFETTREKLGAAYAPSAGFSSSYVYPGLDYVFAEVETQPADVERVRSAVADIITDLRSEGVGADEIERARTLALQQLDQHASSNAYWLDLLAEAQSHPRRAKESTLAVAAAGLRSITPETLRTAAARWLDPANLREVEVLPQ
ncbi:MAG TPA: insulinase family protein [Hyphomonadaceae bacterium]|nr:insulinase family protein [Hyphomonadaceae bacterium]